MGKIALRIKCNLSNVDALYHDSPVHFNWHIKVKCTNCDETNPSWHSISESEVFETTHVNVNFLYKCKCCKKQNTLTILENSPVSGKQKGRNNDSVVCKEYTEDDEGQFRTVCIFECRGMEPIEFEPRGGWAVRSGDKVFSEVEFTDREWCDYNDVNNTPVEITNFESMFVGIK